MRVQPKLEKAFRFDKPPKTMLQLRSRLIAATATARLT
jgi:hypothetical protein